MRILIVNGYSNTAAGKEAFKIFLSVIKRAFEKISTYGLEQNTYIILDNRNVDEYIYIKNAQYANKEAGELFDNIDMIFMDGDANLLPWTKKAYKFGLIFKQAKRCDKALFAAGFAAYMLIYYCATNYLSANVINGNEKGSKLEEIHSYDGSTLPFDAKFLDNETGDLYIYNSNTGSWMPVANTGLHYVLSASAVPIGRFIQNVKIYRGKPGIRDVHEIYTSTNKETVCFVKKSKIQHWAMGGVSQKFLVGKRNAWDPHPVNVTQVGLVGPNCFTLADNDKGPNVLEQRNSLATLFHIENKYPETGIILSNFVRHYTMLIQVLFPFTLEQRKDRLAF